MSQTKERNIGERVGIAVQQLQAYSRLAVRYHEPRYLATGIGEVVRDFIAKKDVMLEEIRAQLHELEADQALMKATDKSPFIQ